MHRFRHESWVRKLEQSHPLSWSTSGSEYGEFHDASSNLEWKKSDHSACQEPPRSWSPEGTLRSMYQVHFNERRSYSPGLWSYKENVQPKRGVNSYKPGQKKSRSRVPKLPPIHNDHVHWIVRENQRHRHPNAHTGAPDLFNFKFRGAWKPSVHG